MSNNSSIHIRLNETPRPKATVSWLARINARGLRKQFGTPTRNILCGLKD